MYHYGCRPHGYTQLAALPCDVPPHLRSLECRLGGCAPSGCLAGPSLAASAVVRVAVGCGSRVAACGNSGDGSWGPQHGRGPDADRKPAWGPSSAGGGGAAADRAWPRPARLQPRPALGGRVFMTSAGAGGPGGSGLTIGGFARGGGFDGRAMDLDLSNLTLAEREAIMLVLQRDQALRKMEERRILVAFHGARFLRMTPCHAVMPVSRAVCVRSAAASRAEESAHALCMALRRPSVHLAVGPPRNEEDRRVVVDYS
ncbi:hypothetical protein HPB50_006168 [Hyalomma asiaticum]|uniref:Uncharacterized protein n=1 Tax=Hyalomma asiaticum TaxID=266040 RepID=A0ACB7RXJ9_HYAAI|nr:hypothetical protein HPB50_006168 [Hyalomma asiaticum]